MSNNNDRSHLMVTSFTCTNGGEAME